MEELKEKILFILSKNKKAQLTEREIASSIKLRGKTGKRLSKALKSMLSSGEVVRVRHNRFSLGEPLDLITGRLDVALSGNGYVSSGKTSTDIFVDQKDLSTALPGDTVVVRKLTQRDRRGKREAGKVIRVVERSRRDIVGTLKSTGKFFHVVPVSPSYKQNFYVADIKNARVNDRVVVRLTGWENKHVSPEGKLIEVLGPADKPSVDTLSIIRHYGFSESFPESVVDDAEKVSGLMERPGKRLDIRNRFIFTIDPETARDFDDALSISKDSNGNRTLGVHIADVAHFVKRGSALDKEAMRRGNSVYLPDKVIPMLPEQLSNGLCSLRPNEDRLAFSAFITFDSRGDVTGRSFAKSIINSKLRLTYEQAYAFLKGESNNVSNSDGKVIREIHKLAQQLRKRRFARHALDLDIPECKIVLSPKGVMTGICAVENDISHQLIEECMIAANEAVAFELSNKGFSLVHRLHEPPAKESIEELSQQLIEMGYSPGNLNSPKNLSNFMNSIKNDPLAYHIRIAVLRSLQRAIYSAEKGGHYGLSKKFYAHFTSPIRRYADLVVHRQLVSMLTGGRSFKYQRSTLSSIARNCSITEQAAQEAERSLIEIKKYRFLEKQLKSKEERVYDAVVVKVMNFGMFVEIVDLQIQGLVHVSGMSNSYVRHNSKKETLTAGKKVYSLGRAVKVNVEKVDFDKRRIDFCLARK